MKKIWSKVIAILLVGALGLSLVGCSNGGNEGSQESGSKESNVASKEGKTDDNTAELPKLLFATHEVGTSNYNVSAELSKLWEDKGAAIVDVQPISPGGMGAPYMFEGENCDLAFINGAPAKWAKEEGTLGKDPTGGYSAMIGSLTSVCAVNFMTQKFIDKYGVTTIEEALRQKLPIRMGCSPKGSMDNEVVQTLLRYFGLTEDDVKEWGGDVIHASGSELASMVKDGKLDFMLDHTSSSSSTMTEISMTADVQFLQWEDETVDYFVNERGFEPVSLPANSFTGQEKEIINPGTPDCIFVKTDLDEDVVYNLTKVMCENRDYLIERMASLSAFHPETCWEPEKNGGIALHPGAEKYFKEAGYIK